MIEGVQVLRVSTLDDAAPKLFLMQLDLPLAEKSFLELEKFSSPVRLEQSRKFRQPDDRARCLGAAFLLDFALKSLGSRFSSKDEVKDSLGRSFFPGSDFNFSLTHSEGWVACALSNADVGVDVETASLFDEGLADFFMSPTERARWENISAHLSLDERQKYALDLWTLKEAYLKARGMGFQLPPESLTITILGSRFEVMGACDSKKSWNLQRKLLPGGYRLSLCWAA